METVKLKPHLFQKFIPTGSGRDVRIIVIGGKAVACMERSNQTDFRSNIAKGGTGRAITPPQEFIEVAERACKELGLDYAGVDLLYGEHGQPILCEVNSNAFFLGMEKATGINVAKLYAEYMIKQMTKQN
jgi:ribosomal protein S6--L-glutamate ligase/gamma-F420-2:alpha-L-glutamate ligase